MERAERGKFGDEVFDVGKFAVDAGEAHVSDLIELTEAFHDHFADQAGGDFRVIVSQDFGFNIDGELADSIAADRAFPASAFDTMLNFFTLERFANIPFFDYLKRRVTDTFVGCEALSALTTEASTSNRFAIFAGARVKNSIVICVTMWADHGQLQAGMLP